jgi:hypothetical protein
MVWLSPEPFTYLQGARGIDACFVIEKEIKITRKLKAVKTWHFVKLIIRV